MATWALLDDGKEIAAFQGHSGCCREDCEARAVDLNLAVMTKKGVALGPGVEVVCYDDDC